MNTCMRRALLVLLPLALLAGGCFRPRPHTPANVDSYQFCFWNVENLFDDIDDERNATDDPYDNVFAKNPDLLRKKLTNLGNALLKMNDGRGPDIIALAEVESERAAGLLRDYLNQNLGGRGTPYKHVLFKDVRAGRHIAPALITRLDVDKDRTRQLEKTRRILETQIVVQDHPLVILASHWTSRVSDRTGGEGGGRAKYGDLLYGRFRAMYTSNNAVDLLMCGDFNDDPDDVSVTQHLRATSEKPGRMPAVEPKLFNLMAGKDGENFGTHSYKGRWHIFDQIVVSPGLLNEQGWQVLPETLKVEKEVTAGPNGRPIGFDRVSGRGYSDHFPVTVRLRVAAR